MSARSQASIVFSGTGSRLAYTYGVSAGTILLVGFVRAIYFGKGWSFYSSSPAFYGKVGLFLTVAVVSLYPTRHILRWRRMAKRGEPVHVDAEHLAEKLAAVLCAVLRIVGRSTVAEPDDRATVAIAISEPRSCAERRTVAKPRAVADRDARTDGDRGAIRNARGR